MMNKSKELLNKPVDIKIKLAGLWTAVMFLYAYADIQHFVLQAGSLQELLEFGSLGGMEFTPAMMFIAALMMTYPTVMIFLSLLVPACVNRWLNIIFGSTSTLTIITIMMFPDGTWGYYYFYNVVEVIITGMIVFLAIRWPLASSGGADKV